MPGPTSEPARSIRSASSADFPTPGCPRTTNAPPRELRASASSSQEAFPLPIPTV